MRGRRQNTNNTRKLIIAQRILMNERRIGRWSILIIDRSPTPRWASIQCHAWSIRARARGRSFITRIKIANQHIRSSYSSKVFNVSEVRNIIRNIPYYCFECPLQRKCRLAYTLSERTRRSERTGPRC